MTSSGLIMVNAACDFFLLIYVAENSALYLRIVGEFYGKNQCTS